MAEVAVSYGTAGTCGSAWTTYLQVVHGDDANEHLVVSFVVRVELARGVKGECIGARHVLRRHTNLLFPRCRCGNRDRARDKVQTEEQVGVVGTDLAIVLKPVVTRRALGAARRVLVNRVPARVR